MELRETMTLWQRLQNTAKPIVLYGTGNGADAILDRCEALGIPVAGIFASDDFVRHQQFRGFTVQRYAELCAKLPDCIILIAFASERPEILERFSGSLSGTRPMRPICPFLGIFPSFRPPGSSTMKKRCRRYGSCSPMKRAAGSCAMSSTTS